jgi:hypothetical protein
MAIVLDGTSGITTPTIAATSASTFTGALALPSGGLNVGSGQLAVDASGRVTMSSQPAFTASSGTNVNGVVDPVLFTIINLNRGGHYNSATGRFTAPVTGVYFFSASVDPTAGGVVSTQFKVNNVLQNFLRAYAVAGDGSQAVSCALQLNAGDYVTIATNAGFEGSLSQFTGFLIG